MSTISTSFTAVGVSTGLLVVPNQTATYGISGTYAATLVFEKTTDGGQTWTQIAEYSTPNATVSATVIEPGTYRWRCSAFTSGTAVATITGNAYQILFPAITNQAGEVVFEVTSDGVTTKNVTASQVTGPIVGSRITRRVVALVDASTVTPNADTTDLGTLATVSQTTNIANPSGTPTDGQLLELRVTAATVKTITFGDKFLATAVALPTATAGSGQTERWLFEWNAATSKWAILAANAGA